MRDAPVDHARILEMRDQYGDVIGQLIDIFADTTPEALAGLASALERDDRETIRAVAHNLKGACQNVGATAIAQHAVERLPQRPGRRSGRAGAATA